MDKAVLPLLLIDLSNSDFRTLLRRKKPTRTKKKTQNKFQLKYSGWNFPPLCTPQRSSLDQQQQQFSLDTQMYSILD